VGLNIITKGEGREKRELDNNSQQSWNLRTGAGAARGPMYPTNLSHDGVQRPTYSPFQLGGHWQLVRTKTECQDGRRQYHGYQGNQILLLTAAFVGWQPQETKYHFLPLYRHMHNLLLLVYHDELSITLLLDGREAAGDKVPQLLVYILNPFIWFFSFGLTSSVSAFPL
jgi:hypothetical protein